MDSETVGSSTIKVSFNVRVSPIAVVLAFGFLVRLGAAFLPALGLDVAALQFWSLRLADVGPWNFYTDDFHTAWPPGYLYVLWLIGGLDSVFEFTGHEFWYILKIPPIAADLGSAFLLYLILEGRKQAVRVGAAALYLLHPLVLLVGPVWGQIDSILAFFLLLTVYYLARERRLLAAVAFTIAFVVKPLAIGALPVFVFWGLRDEIRQVLPTVSGAGEPIARAVAFGRGLAARVWPVVAAALAAVFILVFPFFPSNPLGVFGLWNDVADVYPFNTFYAFNFWALADWPRSDDIAFLGLAHRWWGVVLFAAASLSIIWTFRDARSPGLLALATALSVLAFFLFVTRMHERYLFPSVLLLLTAAVALNSRSLWVALGVLSVVQFFNVYYAYVNFTEGNYLRVRWLFDWIDDNVFLISLITVLTFPALLLAARFLVTQEEGGEDAASKGLAGNEDSGGGS